MSVCTCLLNNWSKALEQILVFLKMKNWSRHCYCLWRYEPQNLFSTTRRYAEHGPGAPTCGVLALASSSPSSHSNPCAGMAQPSLAELGLVCLESPVQPCVCVNRSFHIIPVRRKWTQAGSGVFPAQVLHIPLRFARTSHPTSSPFCTPAPPQPRPSSPFGIFSIRMYVESMSWNENISLSVCTCVGGGWWEVSMTEPKSDRGHYLRGLWN